MKVKFIWIILLAIIANTSYAYGSAKPTIVFKDKKLYIGKHYISPMSFNANVTKGKYSEIALEQIDSTLLDHFGSDDCLEAKACGFDYFEPMLLLHKKQPEMNAEAFGYVMYQLVLSDVVKYVRYLTMDHQVVLDGLISEIVIEDGAPQSLQRHMARFQALGHDLKLTKAQRQGIDYLGSELQAYLFTEPYQTFSVDGYSNLRSGPSVSTKISVRVNNHTGLKIKQVVGDWYLVKLNNNQEGYLHQSQVVAIE